MVKRSVILSHTPKLSLKRTLGIAVELTRMDKLKLNCFIGYRWAALDAD